MQNIATHINSANKFLANLFSNEKVKEFCNNIHKDIAIAKHLIDNVEKHHKEAIKMDLENSTDIPDFYEKLWLKEEMPTLQGNILSKNGKNTNLTGLEISFYQIIEKHFKYQSEMKIIEAAKVLYPHIKRESGFKEPFKAMITAMNKKMKILGYERFFRISGDSLLINTTKVK